MERHGWFEYDESRLTITNHLTGQRLTLAPVAGRKRMGFLWRLRAPAHYSCSYSDPEMSQRLQLALIHGPKGRRGVLELNYSDQLPGVPSYGRWRRVDDFLTDALQYARTVVFQNSWGGLSITGGWRAGVWRPHLKRRFAGGWSATRNHEQRYPVAEAFVIPLNTPSPQGWRYVDVESPALSAELRVETRSGSTFPYLDGAAPVEGFQGKVPFLQRVDGRAHIFPCFAEMSSTGPERMEALLWYTYVDEHVFFKFRTHPRYQLELSTCLDYGFRSAPDKELWPVGPLGNLMSPEVPRRADDPLSRFSHLSYRQWLNARVAMTDAWPMWKSPPRLMGIKPSSHSPDSSSAKVAIGAFGPQVRHGYCAGMVDSDYDLSFPAATRAAAKLRTD